MKPEMNGKRRDGSVRGKNFYPNRGTMGGIGERTMIKRTVEKLARRAPEMLLEALQGDDWRETWLRAFRVRMENGERDAVRLYLEVLKMVGPERQITLVLSERFGVASEEELEKLVSRVKEADQMTDEQRFERTCEWMRGYLVRNPDKVEYARDYVLGQVRVDDAEVVVEVAVGEVA